MLIQKEISDLMEDWYVLARGNTAANTRGEIDEAGKEAGREPVHGRQAHGREAKLGGGGEEVIQHHEDDRGHRLEPVSLCDSHQHEVAEAHLRQCDAELGGGTRLLAAPADRYGAVFPDLLHQAP